MAGFDTSRIIAAFQSGRQIKEDRERKAIEAEDRKMDLQERKTRLKLEELQQKRREAMENANLNPNPTAPTVQTRAPQTTTSPIQASMTDPSQRSQPQESALPDISTPLPLPPRTIPSGYEGGPDTQVPVTSLQQMLMMQEAERQRVAQEARQKSLFEAGIAAPTIVPRGGTAINRAGDVLAEGQPFEAGTSQPAAAIQEYQFYAAQELQAGRKPLTFDEWQTREATRRPTSIVPIVVQTPQGPQIVDRTTGTAKPITSDGETVGLIPTTEHRNRQAALKNVTVVLGGISELSEKINTGQGLIAKASGEVEKAKARLNYNDDVAEYEALISGFTPLVARAVGHVGVLTQQDVDSVRAMFPRPGDSKTLRDRKIKRIETMMAGVASAQGGDGNAPPAESDIITTPDGKRWKQVGGQMVEQ